MSNNLGLYKVFTTVAKQVGGPGKLLLMIAGGGAVVGGAVVTAARPAVGKAIVAVRAHLPKKGTPIVLFTVVADGNDGAGVTLHAGEQFQVVAMDGDTILIAVVEDGDRVQAVSAEFLQSISDFVLDPKTGEAYKGADR